MRICALRIGPPARATITGIVHLSPKICLTSCTSRRKNLSSRSTVPPIVEPVSPSVVLRCRPAMSRSRGPEGSPSTAAPAAEGEWATFTRTEQDRSLCVLSGERAEVEVEESAGAGLPASEVHVGDQAGDQVVVPARADPALDGRLAGHDVDGRITWSPRLASPREVRHVGGRVSIVTASFSSHSFSFLCIHSFFRYLFCHRSSLVSCCLISSPPGIWAHWPGCLNSIPSIPGAVGVRMVFTRPGVRALERVFKCCPKGVEEWLRQSYIWVVAEVSPDPGEYVTRRRVRPDRHRFLRLTGNAKGLVLCLHPPKPPPRRPRRPGGPAASRMASCAVRWPSTSTRRPPTRSPRGRSPGRWAGRPGPWRTRWPCSPRTVRPSWWPSGPPATGPPRARGASPPCRPPRRGPARPPRPVVGSRADVQPARHHGTPGRDARRGRRHGARGRAGDGAGRAP